MPLKQPTPTTLLPRRRRRPWADLSYLKRVAGHRTVPVERGSNYLATDFDEQARSAWLGSGFRAAPRRAAPHRTAPHRAAPHRTTPHRLLRRPAPPRPRWPLRPPTPPRLPSRQLMPLEVFIEKYIERRGEGAAEAAAASGPTAYLAQHRLFDQVPRLREDIQLPDYCALSTAEDEQQTEEEVTMWPYTRGWGLDPHPHPHPHPHLHLHPHLHPQSHPDPHFHPTVYYTAY